MIKILFPLLVFALWSGMGFGAGFFFGKLYSVEIKVNQSETYNCYEGATNGNKPKK